VHALLDAAVDPVHDQEEQPDEGEADQVIAQDAGHGGADDARVAKGAAMRRMRRGGRASA
jgi:N-acetylmuramoyl-L-alanine amidase